MQAAYLNALFLSPPVVLGRQLQPFSLAHIAFLRSIDSPFYNGKRASIDDLAVASFVCSHVWPFPFFHQSSDDLAEKCEAWGGSLGKVDFKSNLNAFLCYVREYSAIPARGVPPGAERNFSEQVPWMFQIAFFLMSVLNFNEVSAWNTPVGRAFAYAAVKSLLNGDETLISEEEESIEEMVAGGMTIDQITEKLDRANPGKSKAASTQFTDPLDKVGKRKQGKQHRKQAKQRQGGNAKKSQHGRTMRQEHHKEDESCCTKTRKPQFKQ
jgi:hypothetical protein